MKNKVLINSLSYYLAWWGIILSAKDNNLFAVLFILALFLIIHFFWIVPPDAKSRLIEIKMIIFFAIVGISIDSILHNLNFFTLKENFLVWLFSIWIIFASTINYSLEIVLKKGPITVFIIGGLFGPLTYLLANNIFLINYQASFLKLCVHFFIWGGLILSFKYRRKFYEQIN